MADSYQHIFTHFDCGSKNWLSDRRNAFAPVARFIALMEKDGISRERMRFYKPVPEAERPVEFKSNDFDITKPKPVDKGEECMVKNQSDEWEIVIEFKIGGEQNSPFGLAYLRPLVKVNKLGGALVKVAPDAEWLNCQGHGQNELNGALRGQIIRCIDDGFKQPPKPGLLTFIFHPSSNEEA